MNTLQKVKGTNVLTRRVPLRAGTARLTVKSAVKSGIKKKRKPSKAKTYRSLMQKNWKLMSEWVRREKADSAGYVKCSTCSNIHLWNSGLIHAGHWIHDKLDFERNNINPQCRDCNYKYNKNVNVYHAIFMTKTYGVEEMERLEKLAREKGNAYSIEELENINVFLKLKLKELEGN